MEVRVLTDDNHEVLEAELCSGYTDSSGHWNTGFYCPTLGNGEKVFCCGTSVHRYCCTRGTTGRSISIETNVLLAVVLGSLAAVLLITLVSCLVVKRCVTNKRSLHTNGGPLYRLHTSSTGSGVANMYSYSGQASVITSPGENPTNLLEMGTNPLDVNSCQPLPYTDARLQNAGHTFIVHNDPPPPYQEDQPPAFSSFSQPLHQPLRTLIIGNHDNNVVRQQVQQQYSTKF